MSISYAQNITDALRYSEDEIQGTARYRALSGAFGALGGDMSAVSINPAGSAIFNSTHASLSLTSNNIENDISYFDGTNNSSNSDLDLNQAGTVIVLNNTNSSSDWRKITFGFAYDKNSNYEDDWRAHGVNPNNTIANYFLANANGNRLDEISRFDGEYIEDAYAEIGYYYGYANQQAYLGYESYIIDPDPADPNYSTDIDAVTSYVSNIVGNNFNQNFIYSANGYNGKVSINFATQYKDNLFLGLNFNSHFIDYDRFTGFYETNSNAGSLVTNVDFENRLKTTGNGFSFQLGAIAKLTPEFRVGLSYNSPTWLRLEEETIQYINTDQAPSDIYYISDIVNVFPEYKLRTPSKLTGSLAYVFGKQGLISFDYSVKDYNNIKFKPTSDSGLAYQNDLISNNLKSAATYKLGGEYRYKEFSFRAGYRMEESPYKDDSTIGDLTGYSLGLGYDFGNTKLDLTYDAFERDSNYQLLEVGFTDSASLNTKNSNVTLSLSFDI